MKLSVLPCLRSLRLLACSAAFASVLRADVVSAWNEALTEFSRHTPRTIDPHLEARAYAMTHVAFDEAIVAAARERRPIGDTALSSAAVASAAQTVLGATLPSGAARFTALADAQLAAVAEGPAKARGIALGRKAAELVLRKREGDNWIQIVADDVARDRSGPAAFAEAVRDGPAPLPWAKAKPFVLRKAEQMWPPPPQWTTMDGAVVTVPGLSRARIFDDVDRSALDEVSRFWSENPLVTWNRVARTISDASGHDPATRARLFAVLNAALADAALTTYHWQWTYGSWRREFRERWGANDDVPLPSGGGRLELMRLDAARVMLPPVRNYPALPAAFAGAAQAALERLCGREDIAFALVPSLGANQSTSRAAARSFTSLAAAAREGAFAATLDDHHSREACVAGYDLGTAIGSYVAKRAGRLAR